jgi:molybdate/tungstate transport system substrate-binding protein
MVEPVVLMRAAGRCFLLCFTLAAACSSSHQGDERGPLVVFNAGSLALPLRAALDSFAAREGVLVEQQNAGSVETARKLTELHRIPDIVAVADYEVIPTLLMPVHASWYAKFARNRMVIAFTEQSKDAAEMSTDSWWRILTQPGVEVGRAEPSLDPNGYRTLLVWQLAELHYGEPGLRDRLANSAPLGNVRAKESDLVALLEAGEFDYIWSYESIAVGAGLRFVRLPREIDLSAPEDSAGYARASVRIGAASRGDSVTVRGQPIVYAFTIPREAPHPELAARFARFLVSADGRRIMREAKLDVLDRVIVVGTGAPEGVR